MLISTAHAAVASRRNRPRQSDHLVRTHVLLYACSEPVLVNIDRLSSDQICKNSKHLNKPKKDAVSVFCFFRRGCYVMGLAPIVLIFSDTVGAACLWNVIFSIGECLWAPRTQTLAAQIAPEGMEATFFSLAAVTKRRFCCPVSKQK